MAMQLKSCLWQKKSKLIDYQ